MCRVALIARTAHQMGVPNGTHFLSPGIQTGLGATTHFPALRAYSLGNRAYQDVVSLHANGDFAMTSTHNGNPLIGHDPGIVDDPRFVVLMPDQFVAGLRNAAQTVPTEAQLASIRQAVEAPARILRSGALVALGTDFPNRAPAVSLHMALRAFAFGLTNHEALQTGTIHAATFSGVGHELGTVEPGKLADLIMIDGDPLADLANVANVRLVMKNGRVSTIDDLLRPYEGVR